MALILLGLHIGAELRSEARQRFPTHPASLGDISMLRIMLRKAILRIPSRTGRGALLTLALALVVVLPASAQDQGQTHTVREGDTLWDIAGLYLTDPLLWPDIYRKNTMVVEDPHWIYPGEVLQLAGGPAVAAVPEEDTPLPVHDPVMAEPDPPVVVVSGEQPDASAALSMEPVPDEYDPANADMSALFSDTRLSQNLEAVIRAYTHQPYRPLRRGEFYSSGFLTEERDMPFGTFLGPVTPPQIASTRSRGAIALFSEVMVTPPEGAQYSVGDTLLVVRSDREIEGYGEVIVPTGLVRIISVSQPVNRAVVIASYGNMRRDQLVLPAEPFRNPGEVRPVPVTEGVKARVIASRVPQELKSLQDVIFLNVGSEQGVAPGDLFRFWSDPDDEEVILPFPLGLAQVVRTGNRTSTAMVVSLNLPSIEPGTPAEKVARLP